MLNRSFEDSTKHDDVVRASAETYLALRSRGYEIDINPDGEQNRLVGGSNNPQYPDIIVWHPEYVGSPNGTAVIIEEVETEESVTYEEAKQWKSYGLVGVKFILTVPTGYEGMALEIINGTGADVTELWIYSKNMSGRFTFSDSGLIKK